jgi:D-sedoheptulose 7-phosphate isomerase
MSINKIVNKNIDYHLDLLNKDRKQIEKKVISLSKKIIGCFQKNKKILIFGNGGSAADAQHFSTELTVRLKSNRKALPSISLVTDTSAISAIGNDFGFDFVFSRQIEALAQKGDLIIPITTSGNSLNIINALKYCKKKKFQTFGILGNKGGKSKKYCSDDFIVSSDNPSRIQEIHIIFWQTVCEIVEEFYVKK